MKYVLAYYGGGAGATEEERAAPVPAVVAADTC